MDIMNKRTEQKQPQKKWFTMTELRHLQDNELDDLLKSFNFSEESLKQKDHASKLVLIMRKQLDEKWKGIE